MSDISLSASMRSNLLSLQNTSKLMDMTSDRLSTGKKVNSALDNPSAYFTAKGLTNRAGDLSSLLDSMTQAINTLKAAEQGLESLTSLVSQAKAVADEAYEAAAAAASKSEVSVTSSSAGTAIAGATTVTIETVNGSISKSFTTSDTMQDLADWLNEEVDGVTATFDGGTFTINGDDQIRLDNFKTVNAQFNDGVNAGNTMTLDLKLDSTFTLTEGSTTGAHTFMSVGGTVVSFESTNSTGGSYAKTGADLYNELKEDLGSDWDIGTDSDGYITITYTGSTTGSIAVTAQYNTGSSLSAAFGDTATMQGTIYAGGNVDNSELVTQYNDLRSQIDALITDTGYKGINLLNGSNLTVNFNEDRTSSLTINGVTFDSSGLGLSTVSGWNTTTDIQTAIDETKTATDTLREQSAKFGRNGSVVQTRQDFTENMVNTLQAGADDLTLADMNEEGANMLALQTRQQLATSTLSMASQASQAVLSLFR